MTAKRPHVEHDWKDRSLKLMEQKREMQERIDGLIHDIDEQCRDAYGLRTTIERLRQQSAEDYKLTIKIGVMLICSIAVNAILATWAVWTALNG